MLSIDSIKNLKEIGKREEEVKLSQIPRYLERLRQTYEFEMNNDWQVRKEIMNPSRYIDKEFSVRYIEYLLGGGEEYRTFYINFDRGRNRMDLIDGRRRIIAIEGYLDNQVRVFKRYRYEDFSEDDKKKVDERVRFKIKTSELKSNIEILMYYNFLNFYRENEIQNNMILLDRLPKSKEEEVNIAIEIGTGREVEYWEYKGLVLESLPIPEWIKEEYLLRGEIYYRDNHWIERGGDEEIKRGFYIYDKNNNKIRFKEKEIFFQYYIYK